MKGGEWKWVSEGENDSQKRRGGSLEEKKATGGIRVKEERRGRESERGREEK
jgi:hypothetical protein